MLGTVFNFIFGWSINIHPMFGLFVIALSSILLLKVVFYLFSQIKWFGEPQKKFNEAMKVFKENKNKDLVKAAEASVEIKKLNIEVLKRTLIVMMFNAVLLAPLFVWMRGEFSNFVDPVFNTLSWVWTYLIISLPLSIGITILMKKLKIS